MVGGEVGGQGCDSDENWDCAIFEETEGFVTIFFEAWNLEFGIWIGLRGGREESLAMRTSY